MPRFVRRVKEGLMPTAEQRRSVRRATMLTAFFGVAHALLFLVSFFVKQQFALVFPAWLLALGGILLLEARRIPADVELPAHLGRTGGLRRA